MTVLQSIGRYKIATEVGRGAMGVVYRGLDPALDREVAVKVIAARGSGIEASIEELEVRFLREARIAAKIKHPGVVTIHDAGREGDHLFLVMELVEGESLAERRRRGVRMLVGEALRLVADVADALAAAHELGVVHRDVKPANILLTSDGRVKVTDFGVAKAVGEGTELTRTGMVIGSPAYMAPEQVRAGQVDRRADLFSLGVVLYELLLDCKPFPADTVTSLIYQILNEDPLAGDEVAEILPPGVGQLLRRCLAKDPEDRFPTAAALAREARSIAASLPAATVEATVATVMMPGEAVSTRAAASPPGLRRWLPAIFAAAAVLGLMAVGLVARRVVGTDAGASVATAAADPTPAVAAGASATATATAIPPTPLPTEPPEIRRLALGGPSPLSAKSSEEQPRSVAAKRPAASPGARPASVPQPTRTPPAPRADFTGVVECRQGVQFSVEPKDARVELDGRVIGVARDFGGGLVGRVSGRMLTFPGAGSYEVALSLVGYAPAKVKVVVKPEAAKRIARIELDLVPLAGSLPRP